MKNIIKSTNDNRIYSVYKLSNNLECLLIQDENTQKSAAAMNVNCGYLQDPVETPGLAHFLEHMLFLGTKKYPIESEYKKYLQKNAGNSNAYTAAMETNYYFQVSNNAIEGALDRFSQFFIDPLFSDSCTTRELNAVDSEHQKNLQQDNWRQQHLFRISGKQGNPFTKFSTGNLETLQKDNIREQLIEFYNNSYSANLMKLVIYSKEDINTMQKWCDQLFIDIPNKELVKPKFTELPFDNDNMGESWNVLPIMKQDVLEFKWLIDYQHKYYKNIPISYISHLIGHEGQNSILSMLKEQGLALSLSSGHENLMDLFSIFKIRITLTNKGLQNQDQVRQIIFNYIQTIKQKGRPQQWIFDEVKKVNKLQFDNKDNEKPNNYVVTLASRMQTYPIENILNAPYLQENFDAELIQQTINSLQVNNLRIYLYSKSIEDICNQEEKIYGIKYQKQKLDQQIIKEYENPTLNFKTSLKCDLPIKNVYIPNSLELLPKPEIIEKLPVAIGNDQGLKIWYKQDTTFNTPKAGIYLKIYSQDDQYPENPKCRIYAALFKRQFNDYIQEIKYMAEMAYLTSSFGTSNNGVDIFVAGFDNSIPVLIKQLVQKLAEFIPKDQESFQNHYEKTQQQYENFFKAAPYAQIGSYEQHIFMEPSISPEHQTQIVNNLNFEDYQQIMSSFLTTLNFEWLAVGNISKEKVIDLVKESQQLLKDQLLEKQQKIVKELDLDTIYSQRCVKLRNDTQVYFEKVSENPEEKNSAIACTFQYMEANQRSNLVIQIIVNILSEPFFSQLRTKEQLGYIVQTSIKNFRNILGISFTIQSHVQGPQYLGERVQMFLKEQRSNFRDLTDTEFLKFKQSVKNKLQEKDQSIFSEISRYLIEIDFHRYQFDIKEQRIQLIDQITRDEVEEAFEQIFFDERKLIEIHIVSQKHLESNKKNKNQRIQNFQKIESVYQFKKSLELYPDYYSV